MMDEKKHVLTSMEVQKLLGGYMLGQLAVNMGIFDNKDFKISRGRKMGNGDTKFIVDIVDKEDIVHKSGDK